MLNFNEARDDRVAVALTLALAGPYAIICIWLQRDNHAITSLLNFYKPDALIDT